MSLTTPSRCVRWIAKRVDATARTDLCAINAVSVCRLNFARNRVNANRRKRKRFDACLIVRFARVATSCPTCREIAPRISVRCNVIVSRAMHEMRWARVCHKIDAILTWCRIKMEYSVEISCNRGGAKQIKVFIELEFVYHYIIYDGTACIRRCVFTVSAVLPNWIENQNHGL